MKTVENELQDKVKVDRGLLNSWFVEVQRTKVKKKHQFLFIKNKIFFYLRKKLTNIENVVVQLLIMINNFV